MVHSGVALVEKIRRMSPTELDDAYGIELLPGGRVYDLIDQIAYNSIVDWARTQVQPVQPNKVMRMIKPTYEAD